jgi:hypothetical protein
METLAPRGDSPPLHVHRTDDEIFHILEGEVRFRVADKELWVRAGETVLAPRACPTSSNPSAVDGWSLPPAGTTSASCGRSAARPSGANCPSRRRRLRQTSARPWLPPGASTGWTSWGRRSAEFGDCEALRGTEPLTLQTDRARPSLASSIGHAPRLKLDRRPRGALVRLPPRDHGVAQHADALDLTLRYVAGS